MQIKVQKTAQINPTIFSNNAYYTASFRINIYMHKKVSLSLFSKLDAFLIFIHFIYLQFAEFTIPF